ncbi:MAG: peptidoglycan DD-metalloendopeptidase family protein [Magnetococcales bacterium]|nr:peptidoglycan DD-metalloendopeptidase family protein [Magnetococcales bacterium]
MSRKPRFFPRLFLISVLFLGSMTQSGAVSEIDNQEHATLERGRLQLNRTVRELVREQHALEQARGQSLTLLTELELIDRSLSESERRLVGLIEEQSVALRLQPELEARIQANRAQVARQKQRLANHLRLMYLLGAKGGVARTLLSQKGLEAGRRGMLYYSRLVKARNQEFIDFRIAAARLRGDLEKGKELTATLDRLTASLTEEQKNRQLERIKRQELLRRAREEETLRQRKVEELSQAKGHLSAFLEKLSGYSEPEGGSFAQEAGEGGGAPARIQERRGHLPNPVPGKWEKRPPGLFYPVAANTPVTAIHAGEVVYADWFKGFGLLLILKHGEQAYTLYGHNHRLMVNLGDRVRAGATIAESGDTGVLDGVPGLYFEMRVNGKTINPSNWLVNTG